MNRLTIIGNIGQDCTVKTVGEKSVINFDVAVTDETKKDKPTIWVSCSLWRKPDKIGIAPFLTKGAKVFVEGNPSVRTYVNRDNQTVAVQELNVQTIELLGDKK